MGRLLAIDYGTKRCGIAVTDPLKIIASPLDVVHPNDLLGFLKQYCENEDVEAFVVGYPLNDDGGDTNSTPHIRGFVRKLSKDFPQKPVHLQDESFSSRDAMQSMIAAGSKKKDRKKKENIDKVSAAIILQAFLAENEL